MTASISKYLNYAIDTTKTQTILSINDIKNNYTLINKQYEGPCLIGLNKNLVKSYIDRATDPVNTYFDIDDETVSDALLETWFFSGKFLSSTTGDDNTICSILIEDGETVTIQCNFEGTFAYGSYPFFIKTDLKKVNS